MRPEFWRKEAAVKERGQSIKKTWTIHQDTDTTIDGLKSRKPAYKTTTKLIAENFNWIDQRNYFRAKDNYSKKLITSYIRN